MEKYIKCDKCKCEYFILGVLDTPDKCLYHFLECQQCKKRIYF